MTRMFALLATAILLTGCASSGHRAPVHERGASAYTQAAKDSAASKRRSAERDSRPSMYVVQKGDTLFSIAFNYGFDYHELAELNDIKNPNMIQIGQQIRLSPNATDARPSVAGQSVQPSVPLRPLIKDQPKVVKYAYSEAAVAQAEGRNQQASTPRPVLAPVNAPVIARAESKPVPQSAAKAADDGEEDALEWSMPTQGKLIGTFSETDNRKGIDIAGKLGQPIFASAPGKVVYSGSGLRGYGKLLIVKHNNTYLSAYAHNDQLLVKEGQTVTRGQKIAEMGNSDSDQVKLHFEVRRFGKPVDPADYLSLGNS